MSEHTDHWLQHIHTRLEEIEVDLDVANGTRPTLRDQFAMAALTGLITVNGDSYNSKADWVRLTFLAYEMADAMMRARDKQ